MKALITSGCSVSETWVSWLRSWPLWLEDHIQPEFVVHSGLGCTGNDLISRKAIYHCTEALKKYKGEDILLVCAYTTLFRTALLLDENNIIAERLSNERKNDPGGHMWLHQGSNYNLEVVDSNEYPAWFYFNLWKDIPQCNNYYTVYQSQHNLIHDYLWNMFAVENFCKANNINYVWMKVDNTLDQTILNHWSVSYLTQALDYQYGIKKPIADTIFEHDPTLMADIIHPTNSGHYWYTNNILIPFLEEHGFC